MASKTSVLSPLVLSRTTESALFGGKQLKDFPSIVGYLENFDAGREASPESHFYSNKGLGRQGVLETALSLVKKWNDIPSLQRYELSRTSKYGPQGFIYPLSSEYQISKLEEYYSDVHNPCHVPKATYDAWFEAMAGPDLVPYTPEQVIQRQLEKNGLKSNSGIMHDIAFVKREKVIAQAIIQANQIRSEADLMNYASVIGARCIKQKERLIFMMPMPVNIVELQYVYALMDAMLERLNCVHAWLGQPYVEMAINEHVIDDKATYLSTDYSRMDTTVGPAQNDAYLRAILPLFAPEFRNRYKRIVKAKETMPVVIGALKSPGTAQGEKKSYHLVELTGVHGKTSGEGDTNCEETVLGILNKITMSLHPHITVIGFEQNGDDGEMSVEPTSVDLALEFASISKDMGFISNPEKQFISDTEIHYLQRVYNVDETRNDRGVVQGAYPMILMVNSLKNPERFASLTRLQQSVRLIEIAQNCYHHPRFLEIAHYVVEGDPWLIELRGKSWSSFHEVEEEWKKMIVTPSDSASHGLAPRGLKSYEFVQLLQEGKI